METDKIVFSAASSTREIDTYAMGRTTSCTLADYYTPIIDDWVAFDLLLNSYEVQTGRSADVGFVLSRTYFPDMAREHLKQWRRLCNPEKVKAHPNYWPLENMKVNFITRKQYRYRFDLPMNKRAP